MLTLCVYIPYIYHSTTLPTVIHNACREGWSDIYIGNTQSVSISFLFLFFFHQSSLYPIKIFAKCFYLLVCILFSAPTLIHRHVNYTKPSAEGERDGWRCSHRPAFPRHRATAARYKRRRMHPGGQFSGQWKDQGCVE